MSSKENSERLAHALQNMKFVDPVSWEGTEFGTINVLCRVQSSSLSRWAKVVEAILKKAEELKGESSHWDSHICRLYMLKDERLVYAWLVAITSHYMDETLSELIPLLNTYAPSVRPSNTPHVPPVVVTRRAVPDADARGNPIVPESHKVTLIPMAGLNPMADRNAPTEEGGGKGAYGMFKSKTWGSAFRPPTR